MVILISGSNKGSEMNPIEKLVDEHKVILRGIDLLEKGAKTLESGKEIESGFFNSMIDFIREFADHYHHAKEEDILFKRMEKAGFPVDTGPVGVMLSEHDEGRGYVAEMESANVQYREGNKSSVPALIENARNYIYLLRQHINKEDNILYPMAENVLGPSGIEAMRPDFDQVEVEKAGTYEKYVELLSSLEAEIS